MVPATEAHWAELAKTMRKEVADEVWATHRLTPSEMHTDLKSSDDVYALVFDGILMGIAGIHRYSLVSDKGSPWFLTTDEAPKRAKWMLRATRKMVNKWVKEYDILINYVDARFVEGVRHARWAGFTVYDAEPYGPDNLPFHRVEIRSSEWVMQQLPPSLSRL
jgi:hypothetical protein